MRERLFSEGMWMQLVQRGHFATVSQRWRQLSQWQLSKTTLILSWISWGLTLSPIPAMAGQCVLPPPHSSQGPSLQESAAGRSEGPPGSGELEGETSGDRVPCERDSERCPVSGYHS